MGTIADLALRAAVLTALAKTVGEQSRAARDELAEAFRDAGSTQARPRLPDGKNVATVSLAGGGGHTARVYDEEKFLEWVLKAHEDEVQVIVRPVFRAKVLGDCAANGGAADSNGEVVPGVDVAPDSSYTSVRFAPGGREAIAAAWARGELSGIAPAPLPPAIAQGEDKNDGH